MSKVSPDTIAEIIFAEVFRSRISEKFASRYYAGTGNEDQSWFFVFEYGYDKIFVIEYDYKDLYFYVVPKYLENENGESLANYLYSNSVSHIFKMRALNEDNIRNFFENYFQGFVY